ncbi:MAG: TIGR04222 domain-containing membrane protein [Planctomycetota bacterium]
MFFCEPVVAGWVTGPTAADFFRSIVFWGPAALIAALVLRFLNTRPWDAAAARTADPVDAHAAAYLVGGYERLADAVMAGMFRAGQIELKKPRSLRQVAERPPETTPITAAVADIAAAAGTVDDARRAVRHVASGGWTEALVESGLALSAGQRVRAAVVSTLPLAVLWVLLVVRWGVGLERHEDTVGVVWTGIVVGFTALYFATNPPRATVAGRRVLRRLKKDHRRSASRRGEGPVAWAWTCALFGLMALPEAEAADLQSGLRAGNGGGGEAGGGDSGDSGCSGCGGCGGCGD